MAKDAKELRKKVKLPKGECSFYWLSLECAMHLGRGSKAQETSHSCQWYMLPTHAIHTLYSPCGASKASPCLVFNVAILFVCMYV